MINPVAVQGPLARVVRFEVGVECLAGADDGRVLPGTGAVLPLHLKGVAVQVHGVEHR